MSKIPPGGETPEEEYEARPHRQTLVKIVSDGGGFGLSEEAYVRWWRHLPLEDQETFATMGGDDDLGRFVCSYEYCSSSEGETPATVARAFAIAFGLNEESNEVHRRANAAWEHPAVRELLDRLLARETERAARRIERGFSYIVEDSLQKALGPEATLEDRAKIINATARYLGYTTADRKSMREVRARLENEALKKAITQQGSDENTDRPLTEEDAANFMRTLEHRFGRAYVRSLMPPAD